MSGNDYDGTLVALEGIDGSGKTTVAEWIEGMELDGREVVTTKEPTDSKYGDWVYETLTDETSDPGTDLFLFCADRRHHMDQIREWLSEGKIVVSDRYADSTRAYQTHRVADDFDVSIEEAREYIDTLFEPWTVTPDLAVYLDCDVSTAMERCDGADKYEKRENLERVRREYERLYDDRTRAVERVQSVRSPISVVAATLRAVRRATAEKGTGPVEIYTKDRVALKSARGHIKNAKKSAASIRRAVVHERSVDEDSWQYVHDELDAALDRIESVPCCQPR